MSEVIDPNIPSVPDPFDLTDCAELPFPLTPTEDQILKHILRICGSDLQMAKRAYDSIICMWSKKIIDTVPPAGVIPNLYDISPNTVYTMDYNFITLTGDNFHPNCRVFKNGYDNGNVQYVSPTEVISRISFSEPSGVSLAVVNPGNIISNSSPVLTVNPHPDTPKLNSIVPVSMSKEIVGMQLVHIHGINFLPGCVVLGSNQIPGLWDGIELPTNYIDSTHVSAQVDLVNTPVGVAVLRVMNKTTTDWYKSYPVYLTITAV